jgi:hypothetical protein
MDSGVEGVDESEGRGGGCVQGKVACKSGVGVGGVEGMSAVGDVVNRV